MIDKKLKEEIERVRLIVKTAFDIIMVAGDATPHQQASVKALKNKLHQAETVLLQGNQLRMLGTYEDLKKIKAEWKTDGTIL